jgi:hypothetical protein
MQGEYKHRRVVSEVILLIRSHWYGRYLLNFQVESK